MAFAVLQGRLSVLRLERLNEKGEGVVAAFFADGEYGGVGVAQEFGGVFYAQSIHVLHNRNAGVLLEDIEKLRMRIIGLRNYIAHFLREERRRLQIFQYIQKHRRRVDFFDDVLGKIYTDNHVEHRLRQPLYGLKSRACVGGIHKAKRVEIAA